VFVKYTGATATNAAYTVTHATGTAAKTVNQTTNQGSWVSLGSYSFSAASTTQQVRLTDAANGTVVADAVKLVRDNSADTDTEHKNFAYSYDPNGNLVQIADSSPGATIDTDAVTYDGLDRVAKVEEKLAGTVKHTTAYTAYDPNSNLLALTHDQMTASSTYDPRDLAATVTNTESAGATPKVEQFTYTPNGRRLKQTKGNLNTVDMSYFFDGLLQHQVEKKPDATIVNEHTYTYDANANQTTDVSKKQSADNASASLAWTYASAYDPRDRITQRTKTDTGTGSTLGTETYAYDANANITSQTVAGTSTSYTYDRNRLLSSVTGGVTASYNYDPFGRLTASTKRNGTATTTTNVTYDPLDRRTSETTNAGTTGAKTTNLTYLGLSTQLLSEDVAGALTKSYQYTPWGERLSEINHTTGATPTTAYYGYNNHTDVDETTDSSGNTNATYGYTAYGTNDQAAFTGVDKPDPQDPTKDLFNPYRFNADRYDPGTGKYDMGFRTYDPGSNRFLTRDLYSGALSDLQLGTDPWTMSRYAFAGGNPLSMVELDGHTPTPDNPVSANPQLNTWLTTKWQAPTTYQKIQAQNEADEAARNVFVQLYGPGRGQKTPEICTWHWKFCRYAVGQVQSGAWTPEQGFQEIRNKWEKELEDRQLIPDLINSMMIAFGAAMTPEFGPASDAEAVAEEASSAVKYTGRDLGFRQNLRKAIGEPPPGGLYDAHHVFPVQFGRDFAKLGIDVNKPEYGTWLERSVHQGISSEYAKDWNVFLRASPTRDQAFAFARMMAGKYGFNVHF